MNRIHELEALSREHSEAMELAERCRQAASSGSSAEKEALRREIGELFDSELDRHFQMEECTIFHVARGKGDEIVTLCAQLKEEHQQLRDLYARLRGGDLSALQPFGALLHAHALIEEEQLFPLVEELFSPMEKRIIIGGMTAPQPRP